MILGVDPGARRVGLAVADEATRWARPLEVIDAAAADPVTRIVEVAAGMSVTQVVVGRPVTLSGGIGPAVAVQQRFVADLEAALDEAGLGTVVCEHDERLTSVIAEQGMRAGRLKPKRRRELRDARAAQVMLQGYLDAQR